MKGEKGTARTEWTDAELVAELRRRAESTKLCGSVTFRNAVAEAAKRLDERETVYVLQDCTDYYGPYFMAVFRSAEAAQTWLNDNRKQLNQRPIEWPDVFQDNGRMESLSGDGDTFYIDREKLG